MKKPGQQDQQLTKINLVLNALAGAKQPLGAYSLLDILRDKG